jgi:hypothetical protein
MADAPKIRIFVSRTSIDIHSDPREMTWKSLGGNSNAIWQGTDLVEFRRILNQVQDFSTALVRADPYKTKIVDKPFEGYLLQ